MTTMYPLPKTCAMCGAESEHMVISSTSTFGSMDLDTRPAPLARHTLGQQIQRCPECNYCAFEIDEPPVVGRDFLSRPDYRAILERPGRPELAREFEAAALIASEEGRHADAGWFLLKAAWACDDEEAHDDARALRAEALRSWTEADSAHQSFGADKDSELLMRVDLMRRAGLYVDAIRLIDESAELPDDLLRSIVAYERQLIEIEDDRTHTVDEALERSEDTAL